MRNGRWLLLSVLFSAFMWLWVRQILGPWEYYVSVERGRVIAQKGDLYPRWIGTRALLLRGQNPYSPDVSHEIQLGFYGHPITQRYDLPASQMVDEQRFAYPLYVVFLLAPTVYMSFAQVQLLASIVLALLVVASIVLWLDILHWRPPRALLAAIVIFVLSCPQVIQGFRLQQLGLLVAFLLALTAWCAARNQLLPAGVSLAFSTIKPQMVVLPMLWFVFWSLSEWPKRWRMFASFVVTSAALLGASQLLVHGWIADFFQGLLAYRKYFPTTSVIELLGGGAVTKGLAAIALVALAALAWRNRAYSADSHQFRVTLSATFLGTTILLPLLTPFNQVLLLLPVFMILCYWNRVRPLWRILFVLIVGWPGPAAVALLLFRPNLRSMNQLPLLPSAAALCLPFVVLVAMVALRFDPSVSTADGDGLTAPTPV